MLEGVTPRIRLACVVQRQPLSPDPPGAGALQGSGLVETGNEGKKRVASCITDWSFLRSAAALLPGPPSGAALHRTGLAQKRAHVLVVTMHISF